MFFDRSQPVTRDAVPRPMKSLSFFEEFIKKLNFEKQTKLNHETCGFAQEL